MSIDLSALPSGLFVLAASRELARTPRKVMFAGVPFALFRDAAGTPHALADRCPHRGVPLSRGRVVDGTLACPYHGYRFDGEGRCVELPGLGPSGVIPRALCASRLRVVEQDGFVWGEARPWGDALLPPRLPHLNDPAYHTLRWSLGARGQLIDGLENFLDATHTHYVHGGLIRRPRARRPIEVEVRREGGVAEARYVDRAAGVAGSTGLISRLFARGIDGRYGRFLAPCIAQLEYRRGDETAMAISALFTPRAAGELGVWAVVTTRRVPLVPAPLVRAMVTPLFMLAIRQDGRMLALQDAAQRTFPDARPVIAPTDVLRPHIQTLLERGPGAPFTKTLTLAL